MDALQMRVLLVDDEEGFVDALEKRLTKRDVTVFTAHSGEQGIQRLKHEPDIDIILLDVKMPGMDGIATLREIKKEHPLVEVIMLTGHGTIESAIEGMKLGAYDYWMKPCEVDQLMAKLEEAKNKKLSHQSKMLEATGRDLLKRKGL